MSVPKSRACEASGQRGLKKKFWKPSPHFSLDLRRRGCSRLRLSGREQRLRPTAVVTAKYPLVWPLTAYGNCRRTRLRPSPAGLTPRVALTGASNFIRLLLFHLSHINDAAAPLPSRCGLHLFCRPHVTVADPLRANDGAQWPCPYCRRTDTQAPRPLHQTQASENS